MSLDKLPTISKFFGILVPLIFFFLFFFYASPHTSVYAQNCGLCCNYASCGCPPSGCGPTVECSNEGTLDANGQCVNYGGCQIRTFGSYCGGGSGSGGPTCSYSNPGAPSINNSSDFTHTSIRHSAQADKILRWDAPGNWGDTNGSSCQQNRRYDIYLLAKPEGDYDVFNRASCGDYTSATQIYDNVTTTEVPINGSHLSWGRSYCVWVVAENHDNRRTPSNPAMFRTDVFPYFMEIGAQLGDVNPPSNPDPGVGVLGSPNPSIGTNTCTTALDDVNGCTAASSDGNFGANPANRRCWVGGETGRNTITFWIEYDDVDNRGITGQNSTEYGFHSLFLLPDPTNTQGASQTGIQLQSSLIENTGSNGGIQLTNSLPISAFPSGPNFVQIASVPNQYIVRARRFEGSDPGGTGAHRIRLYYNIQFLPGFNIAHPQHNYEIYGLLENVVIDPILGLQAFRHGDNPVNQSVTDPNATFPGYPGGQSLSYTYFGSWDVDTIAPTTSISPNTQGYNVFDVRWGANDALQSGIATVNATCYSSSAPPRNFNMFFDSYTPPGTGVNQNIGITANPTNCFGSNPAPVNQALVSNPAGFVTTRYSLDTPSNYDGLTFELNGVTDRACNPATNETHVGVLNRAWYTTHQGSVYSDADMDRNMPAVLQTGGNTIFVNGAANQPVYSEIRDYFINFSTNFLGNRSISNINSSMIGSQVNPYNDLNVTPERFIGINSWYSHFLELIQSNNKSITTITGSTNLGDRVSTLTGCATNAECYLLFDDPGPYEISTPFTCDARAIIFIPDDLNIRDDIITSGNGNGCIFMIQGSLQIHASGNSKDQVASSLGTPPSTSPYDVIDGFYIVEGDTTIHGDNQTVGPVTYSDGLFINGGVVTRGQFVSARDLGLRNNIQPSTFMMYDSRFMYLRGIEDAFNTFDLNLREK